MAKRKGITSRKRFDVFKRDSFTCQYCGSSSPDVVLQIDHITPVSKGGTNDIVNLITSCIDCNSGKSDKILSDDSAVKKQKKQLDELQEKKNQLQMMAEWQKELLDIDNQEIDVVCDIFRSQTDWVPSPTGRGTIKKLIKDFGLPLVCEATQVSIDQYYNGTERSWDKCLSKIGGVCYYKKTGKDETLKQAYYIKGILDNRGIKYTFPVVKEVHKIIPHVGYDCVKTAALGCDDEAGFVELIDSKLNG